MSLKGRTILVTRQFDQAAEFVAEIEAHGGRAVVIPMIQISDPESWAACDIALDRIREHDAIIFTSVNAVQRFLGRVAEKKVSSSALSTLDVYAVGRRTELELKRHAISVRFVPEDFSSDELGMFLLARGVRGKRFLIPKGNLGREDLANRLMDAGADVEVVDVYQNRPPGTASLADVKQRFLENEFDVVTFASPSAAKNFAMAVSPEMFGQLQRRTRIAVIGPTTKEAVLKLKFDVDIEAEKSTAHGLVDAICIFFKS